MIRIKTSERKVLAKLFELSLDGFDALWRRSLTEDAPRTQGGAGIPVINRAPAGQVVDYEEYGLDSGQGFEYIDWGMITDKLAFAVVVVGDSMLPTLAEGDYLILSYLDPYKPRAGGPVLEDNKIVFVRFTQESGRNGCCIARVFLEEEGKIKLQKDNPKFKSVTVEREEIQQMAVAIEYRRKV